MYFYKFYFIFNGIEKVRRLILKLQFLGVKKEKHSSTGLIY